MPKHTRSPGNNVVPMPAKAAEARETPARAMAPAGSPDDPRMKEAMRLMQAFLAIEDSAGRAALITLAERLISDDWSRRVQQG